MPPRTKTRDFPEAILGAAVLASPAVRFIVDLIPVDHRVEGTVACEGPGEPSPFSGWLELLRLLEANLPAEVGPAATLPTDR